MTISIDEFINNSVKSDYTEFEEKQDCFVIYHDKKLRNNEYYQFDWIDRNKKTISNFGFLFDGNNKKSVFITKENGFYIIKWLKGN